MMCKPGDALTPCRVLPRSTRPGDDRAVIEPHDQFQMHGNASAASLDDTDYYPGSKEGHIPTQRAARDTVRFPRWHVRLICSSMRNFLAGVITPGPGIDAA